MRENNPIYTIISYLFSVYFNIIILSNLGFTIGVFPCHHKMVGLKNEMVEAASRYGELLRIY
jgi:hypothetical protein